MSQSAADLQLHPFFFGLRLFEDEQCIQIRVRAIGLMDMDICRQCLLVFLRAHLPQILTLMFDLCFQFRNDPHIFLGDRLSRLAHSKMTVRMLAVSR